MSFVRFQTKHHTYGYAQDKMSTHTFHASGFPCCSSGMYQSLLWFEFYCYCGLSFIVIVGFFLDYSSPPSIQNLEFFSKYTNDIFFCNIYSLALLLFSLEKISFKIKDKNVRAKNTGLLYKIAKSLSVGTSIRLHDHQGLAVLYCNLAFYHHLDLHFGLERENKRVEIICRLEIIYLFKNNS